MFTYDTNFMGPISNQWYKDRGLTKKVTRTYTNQVVAERFSANVGDAYETDEVTTYYAGGRIDIRDDTKSGYDGWSEYAVAPMLGEDWNALTDLLLTLETEELLTYEEIIDMLEQKLGYDVRWANDSVSLQKY